MPDRFDNASFWIPSCAHWTIPNPTRKFNAVPILIVKTPLGQLRFLWHKDYDLLTQSRHSPLALHRSLLLRPQYCCPPKLNFWFSIFERYSLPDKFLTADEIWFVLISFVTMDEQTVVDTDALCFFGASISTIWKYHWRCVFDNTPWHTITVVNSFELKHSGFMSLLSFERKLSSSIDT
ncbi:hypothetical protein BCV71DRAFT_273192 [Rhizopus microsporus]|uniref:Uncharacterized protein n=1 Tax=Rhizopus microsporus TaxID=58291 RepID=A0A1X0RUU0_RHIZD|nr:hypothetical protein BCV71DRAFT_273192 [Rhizopus microsporus]